MSACDSFISSCGCSACRVIRVLPVSCSINLIILLSVAGFPVPMFSVRLSWSCAALSVMLITSSMWM